MIGLPVLLVPFHTILHDKLLNLGLLLMLLSFLSLLATELLIAGHFSSPSNLGLSNRFSARLAGSLAFFFFLP